VPERLEPEIGVDDPRRPEIVAVLEAHLRRMHEVTPPEGVFALESDGLADPSVTFFSACLDGTVVAVGALKRLDDDHAEIKSMHTVPEARGRGVARALLDRLLAHASAQGHRRVSLETGNMDEFAPARSLYASAGFTECPPFGPYVGSTTSTCMTLLLPEPFRRDEGAG
jgi:putative acetyltransferase